MCTFTYTRSPWFYHYYVMIEKNLDMRTSLFFKIFNRRCLYLIVESLWSAVLTGLSCRWWCWWCTMMIVIHEIITCIHFYFMINKTTILVSRNTYYPICSVLNDQFLLVLVFKFFMLALYGGSIDRYHTTCILILNVIKCERYDLMLNVLLIGIQPHINAIQLILILRLEFLIKNLYPLFSMV